MKFAKIVIKNDYEKRGDLVLRSYVRALKKIKADLLLDGNNAFIYGIINDDGKFEELYTKHIIDYDGYVIVPKEELTGLVDIDDNQLKMIKKIIKKVLFKETVKLDFEVSDIVELAKDRVVESNAYDNFLSRVNPYRRLGEEEDQDLLNGYNDFLYKLEQVKTIKRQSELFQNHDEYEVSEYHRVLPKDDDGLYFEKPKIYLKS